MRYSKQKEMIHSSAFVPGCTITRMIEKPTFLSASVLSVILDKLLITLVLLIVPLGLLAQITNGQGDVGIADANIGVLGCGLRHFQDVLLITPTAKGHYTVVNLVNGNVIHLREDLFIPGAGLPLRILFTYNSGSSFNGRYGYGWQMNYSVRYVTNSANGNITVVRPDDRRDLFVPAGDGSFTAANGVRDELAALETGYKLTVWRDLYNNQGDYSEYYFDSPDHPYVTRIVDRNGNTLDFTYNNEKQLTTIADAMGRAVRFQYEDSRLSRIVDPTGRAFDYLYSAEDLTRFRNPAAGGLTYTYTEGFHHLTGITNANGNAYTFSYNGDDGLSQVIDPLDQTLYAFLYDGSPEGITTVSDPKGNNWIFEHDAMQRVTTITDPLGHTQLRTWDKDYRMVALVDGDQNRTTYGYDSHANPTLITNALGYSTQMQYDSTYRKLTSIEDAKGGIRQNEFDPQGNLIRLTTVVGNQFQFTYTPKGLLQTRTEPLGHQIHFTYDAPGNLVGARNALGGESTFSYDDLGRVTLLTDANGNQTHYTYDLLGRVIRITNALNGQHQFEYDPVGNLVSATGLNGNRIQYTFDKMNRLIEKIDALGSQTIYQYDPFGNLIRVTNPNGQTTRYGYDSLGRNTRTVDPLGNQTTYAYNAAGQVIAHTDDNGNVTRMTYDAAHRLVRLTDALGGVTAFAYDPLGSLISRTDASGRTFQYAFNASSRCISQTWPSGKTWLYSYDPLDRMIRKTDPKGVVTQYTYDPLGRLIQCVHPEGHVDWSYDPVGNLTGVSNGLSLRETTSYTYNPLNRLTTSTVNYGEFVGEQTVKYGYDAGGNQTSLTYPDGQVARFTHDAANRRTQVQSFDGTTAYTYDAVGYLQSVSYSNGMLATYRYDAAGRPSALKLTNAAGTTLIDRRYTFDPAGNKLTETHGEDNTSRTLTYDALHRLVGAVYQTGSQTENHAYTYAPGNERLTKTVDGGTTRYNYNDDGLLLQETGPDGTVTYLYDENGNRTRMTTAQQTWDYAYDSQNRLVSSERANVGDFFPEERTYKYTATGQRAMVSDYGWPSYFVFAGQEIIVEQASDWKVLYNPGVALLDDDLVAYVVYDHSGNSVVEIWPEGGWHEAFHLVDFDEFGIKRKGSTEVWTALAGSVYDPFTRMFGSFGYDPFTSMVSRRIEEQTASQYSPFGSALANYNASAAYVNSLRETNPTRYNELLPLLQQQQQSHNQYRQQVGGQILNEAIAQHQAELDRERQRQEEEARRALEQYEQRRIELIRAQADAGLRKEELIRHAALSLDVARTSSTSSRVYEKIDQALTVAGDAGSIAEALGHAPGISWGIAVVQVIYQRATGRLEENRPGTIPLVLPGGFVYDYDKGYEALYEEFVRSQGGGGI